MTPTGFVDFDLHGLAGVRLVDAGSIGRWRGRPSAGPVAADARS